MTHHYSPHTGELILTDNPADWMGSTDIAPPAFDSQTQGCMWIGDTWSIVSTAAPVVDTLAIYKTQALDTLRAMRAGFFNTLAGLQSEALTMSNTADALAIAQLQQRMRDITGTDLSACATVADVDAALLAAWHAAITGMPSSVLVAFKAVTQ